MSSKKSVFVLIAIVIVLAVVCVWLWTTNRGTGPAAAGNLSDYSAVYMITGDIYYGKLDVSAAWPRLSNVWVLQRPVNPAAQVGIAPLKSAFWGPSDQIELNPAQIVFTARLRNDSQMIAYFNNPSLGSGQQIPPQPSAFQGSPTPTPVPTPTPAPQNK